MDSGQIEVDDLNVKLFPPPSPAPGPHSGEIFISKPATILLILKRVDCIDGVAAYLETLVRGLTERGDRVVIVSGPVSTPDGSAIRREAIRAAVLDWIVLDGLQTATHLPMQIKRIMRIIRQYGVTVLAPQGLAVLPYAWMLSHLSGKGVVANYHPSIHGSSAKAISVRRSLKERLAYRTICRTFPATRFIAASKEIERFYQCDCGVRPDRIHYQVFGIDSSIYRSPSKQERDRARKSLAINTNALVCLLSGRLNFVKGHDVAVDAIRTLRRDRPELQITCLFAGSGSQKADIEAYAHRDPADRESFKFLGFINQAERLREIYWAADILLLPSRFEGMPSVISEGMCCGVVPVRTPTGGWQDQFIDGEHGFIIPFNDPAALAARVVTLSDPARLATMRQRAIEHASIKFAKDVMVKGTSDLFRGVASGQIT